ncbi:hypothetical protein [Alicyclobacillus ferrooxydans]|uniref:hypothetical protein n=1 Tax=Alicyclobacillus ferrooxydans TaxID=471514 RepID=UPI0006D54F40|nr:hypothetical protein [Alicyclobacillus ferrooxydans]
MTTRFSLSELAEMLHVPVGVVRRAVDDLDKEGQLTAESFVYGDRNWRVAPSDTKRIAQWIDAKKAAGDITLTAEKRRIKRKQINPVTDEP